MRCRTSFSTNSARRALVELAARVAFMNMSARMNIALGIHSEEFALACGLPPLAERSAVSDAA